MRSVYESRRAAEIEIERQICQGTDKIVSRNFPRVAKLLWPFKTAAHLASISSRDERSAARWLSGETEPPNSVVVATIQEIFG